MGGAPTAPPTLLAITHKAYYFFMNSYDFAFRSEWHVPTSLIKVWDTVGKVTEYPIWWPGIRTVELLKGPELPVTVGTRARYIVSSPLYSLQYETEVEEFVTGKFILARSHGDLVGTGKWTFQEASGETRATFDWNVQVDPVFLRVLSHIGPARAVMHYFHNRLMDAGEKGLRQLISSSVRQPTYSTDGQITNS